MNSKLSFFIAFIAVFFFTSFSGFSQDKIYKKRKKDPIIAKVIEIGTTEVKYKQVGSEAEELVYVLEKSAILRIEFENGKTEYFGKDLIDETEYYEGQKKRALKASFLGPLMGYTRIGYEQNIKPGRSWEARATFVGLGIDRDFDSNATGFIGSIAYKFYRKPSFVTADLRRRHLLQGSYFKPEVFFGSTTRDESIFSLNGQTDERITESTGGLLLNFGKQWIIERFVIDSGVGLGYGAGTSVSSYWVGGSFAFSYTLNIGFTL